MNWTKMRESQLTENWNGQCRMMCGGNLKNAPVQFDLTLMVAIYATLPFRGNLNTLFNKTRS